MKFWSRNKQPTEGLMHEYSKGLSSLVEEFFFHLPDDEKIKLSFIFSSVFKHDVSGQTLPNLIKKLDHKQMLQVQKLVEREYIITKH